MTLQEHYGRLIEAELDHASFNARRTDRSNGLTDIRPQSFGPFRGIRDPGRPGSSYYNRVFVPVGRESVDGFPGNIPDEIKGIEVLSSQLNAEISSALIEEGWEPTQTLNYLVAHPGQRGKIDCRIERLAPDRRDLFFDLLEKSGASFPAELRQRKRDFYCTDQFRCYVGYSRESGEPAGLATLYTSGNFGFLANSFTFPEFRRQGIHRDLLLVRMRDAFEQGREMVYTDVVPGSQSHQNCERAGFRILTTGTCWVRNRDAP